jgi:hypothetical protein
MKRIKVLLDFIELSIAKKIVFYRNVIVKMRERPDLFPNQNENLNTANDLVNKLETDYLAASDGGHSATVAMHASENIADEAFRILSSDVDRIAKGDETTILKSGFNTSKQPSAIQKVDLTVMSGFNSGSVKLVAKAVKGAGSYIWQYAKDTLPSDKSGWISAGFSTQASFEITALTVASKYYFRVAAITNTGTTDFTAAILKVVE